MGASAQTQQPVGKVQKNSLQVLGELLWFFYRDPLRPRTWRIALNSVLLFGSFTLSIAVLFGLPLALIAIIQASESADKMFFPLRRFGISDAGFTPGMIVAAYLAVYLLSVVLAYLSRRMIASDYASYIARVTDSIVEEYDHSITRNLVVPGLFLDRSFFNRISLTGGRTLPRVFLVLMSGLMPLVFGLLSLGAFLVVDIVLGLIVVGIMAVTVPVLIRVANESMKLNRAHVEDNKAFTESFRAYSDVTVFLPQVERENHHSAPATDANVQSAVSAFNDRQREFYDSFERKQLVQDNIRIAVGLSTFLILAACFGYYLYVPFAQVRIGALFVLVLSFRYFITAVSGLSSSFVSLIGSHQDLVEIIDFKDGYRFARENDVPELNRVNAIDAGTREPFTLDLHRQNLLEIVTGKAANGPNVTGALAQLFDIAVPTFFANAALIGLPQHNYREVKNLESWLAKNSNKVCHLLDIEPEGDQPTTAAFKKALEKRYFADRGLVLPNDLWTLVSEWAFAHLRGLTAEKNSLVVLNGETAARLPHVLRQLIVEKESGAVVVFYYRFAPKVFVSAVGDPVLDMSSGETVAVRKTGSADFASFFKSIAVPNEKSGREPDQN